MQDRVIQDVLHRHQVYEAGIADLVAKAQATKDAGELENLAEQIEQAELEHRAWAQRVMPALTGLQGAEERLAGVEADRQSLRNMPPAPRAPQLTPEQAQRQETLAAMDWERQIMRFTGERQTFERGVIEHNRELRRAGGKPRPVSIDVPVGPMRELQQGVAQLHGMMAQVLGEITRPKTIERDAEGYPVSVGGRPIVYRADGLISRIG